MEQHGEKVFPDAITPVEGWRIWFMRPDPLALRSYYLNHFWSTGKPTRSKCLGQRRANPGRIARWFGAKPQEKLYQQNKHRSPHEGCACGIWAMYRLEKLKKTVDGLGSLNGLRVVGRIRGWGRVTLGTDGWRSEIAEVMCLVKPENVVTPDGEVVERIAALTTQMGEAYGVPVISGEEAEAWDQVES